MFPGKINMADKNIHKLVLHPVSTDYASESWINIKQGLYQARFIGKSISSENESYLVGDNFLQLITFLGCSPHIEIVPEEENNDSYCRIVLSELNNKIHFRFLARDVIARCPKCRKKLDSWSDWLNQWKESSSAVFVKCEHCDSRLSLFDLNWRHSAAFARCFIDIWNIYPQEAIPTEELLSILFEATGEEWDYFFSD